MAVSCDPSTGALTVEGGDASCGSDPISWDSITGSAVSVIFTGATTILSSTDGIACSGGSNVTLSGLENSSLSITANGGDRRFFLHLRPFNI